MENKHPIENLMKTTMENLKDMIDVNTVIGDGIETADGGYIIPISKVSFGFASGGSDFPKNRENPTPDGRFPFGGGSGSGVTVKPVAFLVLQNGGVRLLQVDQNNTYDRIIDTIPQVMDRLKDLLSKDKNSQQQNTSGNQAQNTQTTTNMQNAQNSTNMQNTQATQSTQNNQTQSKISATQNSSNTQKS